MHKKRTNEQHDKNEERRGPNPEKVEGGRKVEPGGMGARRVGGPEGWGPDLEKVRAPRVGSEGSAPAAWGLEGWGIEGGPLNISRFFPSPAPIFALFLSLWGSSRGNLVVRPYNDCA